MKTNLTMSMLLVLAVALPACEKKPADTTTAQAKTGTPTPGTSTGTAPTVVPPAVVAAQGAALLTEEKVKGFVAYTRAIAPVASEAMGMAGAAYARSKGDKAELQKEMLKDERTKKLAEVGQVALKQSGLSQSEVAGLSRILARHYAKRMMAVNAAAELAKLQAKPAAKPGILDGMYKKQVADGEAARAEFEKTYGKAALAIADKYEKEYLEAQQLLLKAAFKHMKPPAPTP